MSLVDLSNVIYDSDPEMTDMYPEMTDVYPEMTDMYPEMTDVYPEMTDVLEPDFIDDIPSYDPDLPPQMSTNIDSGVPSSVQIASMPPNPRSFRLASEALKSNENQLIHVYYGDPDGEITQQNVVLTTLGEYAESLVDGVNNNRIEDIGEAMESLKSIYTKQMVVAEGNKDMQTSMMEQADEISNSLSLNNSEQSFESNESGSYALPEDIDVMARGGGRKKTKDFAKWEENTMKCMEEYVGNILYKIPYIGGFARSLAWGLGAFFRVVGYTWSVFIGTFKFIWSNKIQTLLFLSSFFNIMKILKPVLMPGVDTIAEASAKRWMASAQQSFSSLNDKPDILKTLVNGATEKLTDEQIISNLGKLEYTPFTSSSILETFKSMVSRYPNKIEGIVKDYGELSKSADAVKLFSDKMWTALSEYEKWVEYTEKYKDVPLTGLLLQKKGGFMGGLFTNPVEMVEDFKNGAIDSWEIIRSGAYLPNGEVIRVPYSDYLVPDALYAGDIPIGRLPEHDWVEYFPIIITENMKMEAVKNAQAASTSAETLKKAAEELVNKPKEVLEAAKTAAKAASAEANKLAVIAEEMVVGEALNPNALWFQGTITEEIIKQARQKALDALRTAETLSSEAARLSGLGVNQTEIDTAKAAAQEAINQAKILNDAVKGMNVGVQPGTGWNIPILPTFGKIGISIFAAYTGWLWLSLGVFIFLTLPWMVGISVSVLKRIWSEVYCHQIFCHEPTLKEKRSETYKWCKDQTQWGNFFWGGGKNDNDDDEDRSVYDMLIEYAQSEDD